MKISLRLMTYGYQVNKLGPTKIGHKVTHILMSQMLQKLEFSVCAFR